MFSSFAEAYEAYISRGYKSALMDVGKINRRTYFMVRRDDLAFVAIDPAGRVVECHALSISDWEWPRFGVRETYARHFICSMLAEDTRQYLEKHGVKLYE